MYRNPKRLLIPEFHHLVPAPKLCEYTTDFFFQEDDFLEAKLTIIIYVCDTVSSKCW